MDLTKDPLPELIKRIAVPASTGFFFSTMYNVVDTFYAGLISTQAIAALSLSFPVFFIIVAMGSGVSVGSTALIANALGERDSKNAKIYAAQSVSFGIMISLLLAVTGLALSPYLFTLLGATGQYLDDALSYMNIIFLGTVFFMTSFILNSGLRAIGDTRTFRNFMVAGFFLNLILDPWFMFGGLGLPPLGLSGVAWATVVIQAIGTAYMAFMVCRKGILCRDSLRMMVPRKRPYLEISRQGFPASLNMMTVAVGIFIITFFVSSFGREAVAAYGIATRVEQMALLPGIGLNMAAMTLCGQNNGARKFDRVREAWNLSVKYGALIVIPASAVVFLFPEYIMGIFTADSAVISIGAQYLPIAACIFVGYSILFTSVAALQGMKKPLYAVWIGIYRQIAAPILIFPFLSTTLAWGLYGIWWGVFILVCSSAAITLLYTRHVLRNLGKCRAKPEECESPKHLTGSPSVLRKHG